MAEWWMFDKDDDEERGDEIETHEKAALDAAFNAHKKQIVGMYRAEFDSAAMTARR